MEFAFPWPYSPGEWLAWTGALLTVLWGLAGMLAPRLAFFASKGAAGVAGARSIAGGFHVGIGISAILFAQPLIYLALGIGWALAALGQVLSILFDGGRTGAKAVSLLVMLVMAALPLAFVLGFVA
jgi:hypothetical protein